MSRRSNGNSSRRRSNPERDARGEDERPNRSKRQRNSTAGRPPRPERQQPPPAVVVNRELERADDAAPARPNEVDGADENPRTPQINGATAAARPFPPFPLLRDRERPPSELPAMAVNCRCCGHWYKDARSAEAHEVATLEDPRRLFRCSFCWQNFATSGYRNGHELRRHNYERENEQRDEMGAVEMSEATLKRIFVDELDAARHQRDRSGWSTAPRSLVVNRFQPPAVVPNDRRNVGDERPNSSGMPAEVARCGIRPADRQPARRRSPVPPPIQPQNEQDLEPPMPPVEVEEAPLQIQVAVEQPVPQVRLEVDEAAEQLEAEAEVQVLCVQPSAAVSLFDVMSDPPAVLYYNRQEAKFGDLPADIYGDRSAVRFLFVRAARKHWKSEGNPPVALLFSREMPPIDGRPSNMLVFGRSSSNASLVAINRLLTSVQQAESPAGFVCALAAWAQKSGLSAAFFLSASEAAVDLRAFPNVRIVQ